MRIEMDKKYQTRDGNEVKISCTDGNNPSQPVVGYVLRTRSEWEIETWDADGHYIGAKETSSMDLVPAPAKNDVPLSTRHEGWVVIEKDFEGFHAYHTIFNTLLEATSYRDACFVLDISHIARIEWEE